MFLLGTVSAGAFGYWRCIRCHSFPRKCESGSSYERWQVYCTEKALVDNMEERAKSTNIWFLCGIHCTAAWREGYVMSILLLMLGKAKLCFDAVVRRHQTVCSVPDVLRHAVPKGQIKDHL